MNSSQSARAQIRESGNTVAVVSFYGHHSRVAPVTTQLGNNNPVIVKRRDINAAVKTAKRAVIKMLKWAKQTAA